MNPASILGVVVQYGLPTVLLFAMAWWYARQQTRWEDERKELYKAWNDAVLARVEDAREYGSTLTEAQQATDRGSQALARLTDEWQRWQEHDRQRELRAVERERDRSIHDSGSHRPIDSSSPPRQGPKGGTR